MAACGGHKENVIESGWHITSY